MLTIPAKYTHTETVVFNLKGLALNLESQSGLSGVCPAIISEWKVLILLCYIFIWNLLNFRSIAEVIHYFKEECRVVLIQQSKLTHLFIKKVITCSGCSGAAHTKTSKPAKPVRLTLIRSEMWISKSSWTNKFDFFIIIQFLWAASPVCQMFDARRKMFHLGCFNA